MTYFTLSDFTAIGLHSFRTSLLSRGEPAMRSMGLLSTALLGATAIAAAIVLVVSMPDIQRYLRMRKM
ncbi:hypothetical protein RER_26560 [Rhodococcus erythropolis PR4]|uniref:Uncharacterized protein n=3 Tax=Rhodococcus erythropolis group TaxID=2840174 RepID=C0ZYC9_RHOE4|nr:hypothetical protein RER_26560 [Rhodococcus erythropolis PR4]